MNIIIMPIHQPQNTHQSPQRRREVPLTHHRFITIMTRQIVALLLLAGHFLQETGGFSIQSSLVSRSRRSILQSTDDDSTFDSLGLSSDILSAIRAQPTWETPTPIQRIAVPQILKGQATSLWCEAPTGSGKTAAFVLPLLQKLYTKDTKGIASLVLCPTRELAMQIGHVISQLSYNVGGKKSWQVVVLHGGVPLEPQIVALSNAIRSGRTVDVVVATPGRLVDVLTRYDNSTTTQASESALERRLLDALDTKGKTDASLSLARIEELKLDREDDDGRAAMRDLLGDVRYLVIDEADRMLGRAFESEVDACLDLLMNQDRDVLPTWLFSATFPKSIEPRVDYVLRRLGGSSPLRISCSASDRIADDDVSASLQRRLDRTSNTTTLKQTGPASTINLRTLRLDTPKRTQVLRKLLEDNEDWDRVLVFVSTRYAAEHVARKLRRNGIEAAELHGKLDQEARTRRLNAFAKGKTRVLLATDVASRGLDVVGLPAVVNYDLPRSTSDFVHRVGRTGRAGHQGTAITFLTPSNEAHLDLIEMRHLPQPVEREVMPGFEPDESEWEIQASASRLSAPGTMHSTKGLAYDRMNGGIKGRRKSKKDRVREQSVRESTSKE